ncbi:uncharacterized protein LOC126859532 [Cataglyphis hispanica]|uniref:uncharacterized protein LOC126859532 n=1 Tax=Cataglyphis hispanica TaxID=1086592 RepID=UPI00218038BE|nr:uncharacterized protein LOC126859532 [Cataglyphis hispanica]
MYSDTTELDGENEDVASWSSERTINDNRNDTSSVREFGDFIDNHGWIQCRSKSYPGRVYFYNTHSGCNTWYRPISRYTDIPLISIKRIYQRDDVSADNIELLSVSDNENEPDVSSAKCDGDKSLTPVPDVIAQYYYTPQVDSASDSDDSCNSSVDVFASECHYEKEQIDKNNDENIADEKSDSEMNYSALCATNFLETEFFVGENDVSIKETNRIFDPSTIDDISSATTQSPSRFVYDVPRLKRISFEDQLIKPRRTRVSKHVARGPRKIICEMYGVRTINYDLPIPDQVREEVGVKTSTLSESDSDVSEPPLQNAKTSLSFESEWHDIEKNLHQPLLSDPSSSPSSRSDTNSSTKSWKSTSSTCSCSTCSSCTTCSSCE